MEPPHSLELRRRAWLAGRRRQAICAILLLICAIAAQLHRPSKPIVFPADLNVVGAYQPAVPVSLDDRQSLVDRIESVEPFSGTEHTVVALGNETSYWAALFLRSSLSAGQCRILGVGSSRPLAVALSNGRLNVVIDTNGYGFGYQSVLILATTPERSVPNDREETLAIAERVFHARSAGKYLRFFRSNQKGVGESYVSDRFISDEAQKITLRVPLATRWWQQFALGCRKAADDCGIDLNFENQVVDGVVPEMPLLSKPIVRLVFDRTTREGLINGDVQEDSVGLLLIVSSSRLAQSIWDSVSSWHASARNDTEPMVWILHPEEYKPLAAELAEKYISIDRTKVNPK
ncbi:MAG: hypothetical protein AAGJ40_05725 [Planctomycetota bacterium]